MNRKSLLIFAILSYIKLAVIAEPILLMPEAITKNIVNLQQCEGESLTLINKIALLDHRITIDNKNQTLRKHYFDKVSEKTSIKKEVMASLLWQAFNQNNLLKKALVKKYSEAICFQDLSSDSEQKIEDPGNIIGQLLTNIRNYFQEQEGIVKPVKLQQKLTQEVTKAIVTAPMQPEEKKQPEEDALKTQAKKENVLYQLAKKKTAQKLHAQKIEELKQKKEAAEKELQERIESISFLFLNIEFKSKTWQGKDVADLLANALQTMTDTQATTAEALVAYNQLVDIYTNLLATNPTFYDDELKTAVSASIKATLFALAQVLWQVFKTNAKLQNKLQETSPQQLYIVNTDLVQIIPVDEIFGVNDTLSGFNILGQLLMNIRSPIPKPLTQSTTQKPGQQSQQKAEKALTLEQKTELKAPHPMQTDNIPLTIATDQEKNEIDQDGEQIEPSAEPTNISTREPESASEIPYTQPKPIAKPESVIAQPTQPQPTQPQGYFDWIKSKVQDSRIVKTLQKAWSNIKGGTTNP